MQLDQCYRLAKGVAIRPERFGALLYSYYKRQLYFLYDQRLVDFVNALDGSQTLDAALDAFLEQHNLAKANKPVFVKALAKLETMEVLEATEKPELTEVTSEL